MRNSNVRFTHLESGIRSLFFGTCLLLVLPPAALAQAQLHRQYPELANLFNAFDVTQAALLQQVVTINEAPANASVRMDLQHHLMMMADMSMDDMMASGMKHGGEMDMPHGPYGAQETTARTQLMKLLRATHSDDEAANAFASSEVLGTHAARVFRHGREFENQLFDIYLDAAIKDKQAAVDAAVQDYLQDARHALPVEPKAYSLFTRHDQASAFQTAFPSLSGLQWSAQWLQLASLEAIMVEYLDPQFSNTVGETVQRFWNKVGSESGMSMFPAPVELPMAPTIAPHLYLLHPQAAIILDNLNKLETVVADILAYPNLENRPAVIGAAVAEFTNPETNLDKTYDYLLAALRGGIYNQGGPAVGDLDHSERNRSRAEMEMKHAAPMRPGLAPQ